MTTQVHVGVHCPNVHKAQIRVEDKRDGEWVVAQEVDVALGADKSFLSYITDTRRIVIEEVPST
jgi:hypothetical protein